MTIDPLRNPGVSPSEKAKPVEPSPPTTEEPTVLGDKAGPQGQPKPFNLPEPSSASQASGTQPSVMELQAQGQKISPQDVSEKLNNLNNKFGNVSQVMSENAELIKKYPGMNLKKEQLSELRNNMGGLNEDLRTIASLTGSKYQAPKESDSLSKMVLDFIQGGQSQYEKSLQYLSNVKNPNPADMLRLSYTVQRATQKTELFSSIISSGVSGIKTLMGTQLG